MDTLAVVPARGGSSRVPRKNLREVAGKPLIAHTLEQAAESEALDRTIVSTDDEEIQMTAREYGGEVPFTRPAELATDEATSPPVVEHALDWVERHVGSPDIVVMLQVTTPLRTAQDIDDAVAKIRNHSEATSLVSISEYDEPPYWAVETEDDVLRPHFDRDVLWTDNIPRSQDLPTLYHPNGAIFAARTEAFREEINFYTDVTIGYEMPPERSIDIDEPFELELVRTLMESNEN
ncbi:N-acylneuraminate cytidylyltransferase [Halopelagius inordinatus]|uniref:N-acylneuraminate cytidylyltransferase n=1 Tax=Halopelagius inordinatus TaxID=553467 RepID=A0A1I2PM46_9EURY|nr:acylneuraminate cytidylyltransferase family protein [Halopelagius inordinatus]SFG17222.1 N-acylneuraminate cytidylyltransferase [Halopelagius inordinatus]